MLFGNGTAEPIDLHRHPSQPPCAHPVTPQEGGTKRMRENTGLRKAIPWRSGQVGPWPVMSPTELQPQAPQERSPQAGNADPPSRQGHVALPCHLTPQGCSGEKRQRPRLLPQGRILLHPSFLEKVRAGSSLCAPDKVPSAYLLPAGHFPGTLHFPDVSSSVAVSWYRRQELLRRCLTPSSSFSLLAGPP